MIFKKENSRDNSNSLKNWSIVQICIIQGYSSILLPWYNFEVPTIIFFLSHTYNIFYIHKVSLKIESEAKQQMFFFFLFEVKQDVF